MIESLSTSRLALYKLSREVFELVPNKAAYTYGPTGDFDSARTMELLGFAYGNLIKTPVYVTPEPTVEDPDPVPVFDHYDLSSDFEIPGSIINYQAWQCNQLKSTASTIPTAVYQENLGTLDRLNFWPIPTESCAAVLYARKALEKVTDDNIDEEMALPPGYEEAFKYNLAVRLAPEYGKEISAAVVAIARDSLAAIKKQNSPTIIMKSDAFGVANGGKNRFNILTGDFR
jgi:hypothetical protein